jgi:tetratricopeptide (TPR) repeat protein
MIRLQSIKNDPDWLPKLFNLALAVVAFLLIAVSLIKPWFAVPHYEVFGGELSYSDSALAFYFKLVLILIFIASVAAVTLFWNKRSQRGGILIKGVIMSFVMVVWFPAWLTQRDSNLIGDAAWVQQQHDTLTWLGGDVYRSHSERSVELGTGVNAQDPPDRLAVYRPPSGSIGVTQINDWLWWFGYGPSFTQFVASAWFYAVIGYLLAGLCVCGLYWRRSVTVARKLYKQSILFFIKVSACVIALTAGNVYMAHHSLKSAKLATAMGDYATAKQQIEDAIGCLPSLECDSGVIRQLGYCDVKLENRFSAEAQFYQVDWLERHGHYARARAQLDQMVLSDTDVSRNLARELSRQQLRVAINNINSGRYSSAIQYLDSVLARENNSIQACFHRQLVALQTSDLRSNKASHSELIELYRGLRSKNKKGVIASSNWMLAQGELRMGNVNEAWEARKRSMGK